ncbi:ESAT-6-like protein esxB [Mycobacterium kansasii 732]|uniref:ESAT-6-like protein n=1 Tax=Mycobacterium pseudokansasii TaxID=2341080 RepID=A0A498R2Q7_9MYCO|nr:WXG100 family type VII secretion target [Mycobacterium pseudokansasii]EUA07623.1 ESAT-6-like protein esxB [Mycobacterium kansasii 732]KZS60556.1 type VII secretion protein EsxB [Mycobacterium kansasii]VBA30528.1 ESAT-6-like protein EsxB [Mycobacterium pseudokansasii]VBA32342.1 ESAT-6-like protein EsxB [Mycobacterium pseudokansasii]VBA54453.1 ESAT-6-like protein EsxB [Mycobacterium pseudokansasii]
MAQMNTDAAVLAKEATNFDRIYEELTTVIAKVESTANSLSGGWHGQAGHAAQGALQRFHEAGSKQIRALTEISNKIHAAGGRYSSADDEHAGSLASAMNF